MKGGVYRMLTIQPPGPAAWPCLLCFLCINMRIFRITGSRSDLSGLVHGGIAALCERRPGMKFIIEPSAASGMIRLPLKKEMKVPSLWEIMVSKYFSVKIYKY